jgi:hypothetical protein
VKYHLLKLNILGLWDDICLRETFHNVILILIAHDSFKHLTTSFSNHQLAQLCVSLSSDYTAMHELLMRHRIGKMKLGIMVDPI